MPKCTLRFDTNEFGEEEICDGCLKRIKHDEKRINDDGNVVSICKQCAIWIATHLGRLR